MRKNFSKIEIFGLNLLNATIDELIDSLVIEVKKKSGKRVNFVNAHCVNIAVNNFDYLKALHNSQLYADGIGMFLAAKFTGKKFVDNVNGTDLFPEVCKRASQEGISLALFGSQSGVVDKCAQKMRKIFPGLQIAYVRHGFYQSEEELGIVNEINESGADILFLALGVPKQELFIERWNDELHVGVKLGVGALFDFYSGNVPRAPLWIRKSGFEWLYRLYQEPIRLCNRYVIGNFVFLTRVLYLRLLGKEKLQKNPLGLKIK